MHLDMKISPQFVRAVQDNLGEQGKALVEKLPALLSSVLSVGD